MRATFKGTVIAAGWLALVAAPVNALAFGLTGFGGKVGYINPQDLDGAVAVGAHLEFESAGTRVHLLPSIMYWKSGDMSDVNPNMDAYYHFLPEGTITPYVGGGLGLNFTDNGRTDHSSTDLGANLFAGLRFPAGFSHYFMEGRYTISDINQFSILGGVTFHR